MRKIILALVWTCVARNALDTRVFLGYGPTDVEARYEALTKCEDHHFICYISKCYEKNKTQGETR